MKVKKVISEKPFIPFCIIIQVENKDDYDQIEQEFGMLISYLVQHDFKENLTVVGKIKETLNS